MASSLDDCLAGSHDFVTLQRVVESVAQRLQGQWVRLINQLPAHSEASRPVELLHFLHASRQSLLRLAMLVNDPVKLTPVRLVAEPGSALDMAASHARALQAAADGVWEAHIHLKATRVPLFDVATAEEVLLTGTLSSLPSRIEEFAGKRPLEPERQALMAHQLNHLLLGHLLKAELPPGLELVEVSGGSAVLRCKGLYEARLSLVQQPYPEQVHSAACVTASALAEPARTPQTALQEGKTSTAQSGLTVLDGTESPGPSPAPVLLRRAWRWQWVLLDAVLLPNAANRAPLRDVQREGLLSSLRLLMARVADVAAIEAAKPCILRSRGEDQGDVSEEAREAVTHGASVPPARVAVPPAELSPSRMDVVAAASAPPFSSKQPMQPLYADELASPLHTMHGVLRDLGSALLVEAVRATAGRLAGPGSRWEGHLRQERAQHLRPGVRLCYWLQAPAVAASAVAMAVQETSNAVPVSAETSQGPVAAGGHGDVPPFWLSPPALEVGVGPSGYVEVLHEPAMGFAATMPQGTKSCLELDAHRADVEGLLLSTATWLAARQMQRLREALADALGSAGLQDHYTITVTGGSSEPCLGLLAVESSTAGVALGLCSAGGPSALTHRGPSAGERAMADAARGLLHSSLITPPGLEVAVEGCLLLRVAWEPWSGRLLLRPGVDKGGDNNYEALAGLHAEQERLQSTQQRALQQAQQLDARGAAHLVLQRVAARLAEVVVELWARAQLAGWLSRAQALGLHPMDRFTWMEPAAAVSLQQRPPVYLSFPTVPLPTYVAALSAHWNPSGSDAGGGAEGYAKPATGPHARHCFASALCFVLRAQFPPVSARRFWLIMGVCNERGMPVRAVKHIALPTSAYCTPHHPGNSTTVCRGGAPGSIDPSAASSSAAHAGSRKRRRAVVEGQRSAEGEPQLCAAASADAPTEGEEGSRPGMLCCSSPARGELARATAGDLEARSTPRTATPLPRLVGAGGHDQRQSQHQGELARAVVWCRQRMDHERLLFECQQLRLDFQECLPGADAGFMGGAAAAAQRPPYIRILNLPGTQVFSQLLRRPGAHPARVGVEQVVLMAGPAPGVFSMRVAGTLFAATTACSPFGACTSAAGAVRSSEPAGGQCLLYRYRMDEGDSVRDALLDLQRLLHMQALLQRLEALALGAQQLCVGSQPQQPWAPHKPHVAPEQQQQHKHQHQGEQLPPQAFHNPQDLPDAQCLFGWTCAAEQAANGIANGGHGSSPVQSVEPLSKKARTVLLPTASLHEANANGWAGHELSSDWCSPLRAGSPGRVVRVPVNLAPMHAQDNGTALPQPSRSTETANGPAGVAPGASGLLWHWPGTGLVKLSSHSHAHAVLECGAPLQQLPAALGLSHKLSQKHVQQPARLRFHISWMGLLPEDGACGGKASGCGQHTADSLPCTAPWAAANSTAVARLGDLNPLQPETALGVRCCVRCEPQGLPEGLAAELADMADEGAVGELLDLLAIVGWPLSVLLPALSSHAMAAVRPVPLTAGLVAAGSPYSCRLVLGAASLPVLLSLRFTSHGRLQVAFPLEASLAAPAASAAQQWHPPAPMAHGFLQRITAAQEQGRLEDIQVFPYPMGAPNAPRGFWVHAAVLPQLLPELMAFMSESLAKAP